MPFVLDEQIERRLTGDQVAWLTTVTPTGRPAPRPVWFVWDGTSIVIYSLNDGAKLRHIAANDRVTVSFNTDEQGLDVVVIAGRAERVPDALPPSEFPGFLDKYATAVERLGAPMEWYDANYGVAVRVTPDDAWTIAD